MPGDGIRESTTASSWASSDVGFVFIVLFLVVAIFAPWLAPHDPWEMLYDQEGEFASLRPPSWEFPMGTTHLGYDLFSQLILATRTTLLIGAISGGISILIGANIGLIAGYYGGKVDEVLMRFTDVLYGMPFLPFIIVSLVWTRTRVRHPRNRSDHLALRHE